VYFGREYIWHPTPFFSLLLSRLELPAYHSAKTSTVLQSHRQLASWHRAQCTRDHSDKMVRMAEPQAHAYRAAGGPVESTGFRKFSSIPMIILLYTAATPFSPISWISYDLEGSFFLDRLLAGVLLFAAVYFQWQLAAQTYPVAICLPTGPRQTIRNGRVESNSGGGEVLFIYKPAEYWKYIAVEAALLAFAEFGGYEIWRRGITSLVVAALWSVGWFVTPESVKREGWEYVKKLWFWIALDEVMRIGIGAGRRRAQVGMGYRNVR
jgi:hypothetical protein